MSSVSKCFLVTMTHLNLESKICDINRVKSCFRCFFGKAAHLKLNS